MPSSRSGCTFAPLISIEAKRLSDTPAIEDLEVKNALIRKSIEMEQGESPVEPWSIC